MRRTARAAARVWHRFSIFWAWKACFYCRWGSAPRPSKPVKNPKMSYAILHIKPPSPLQDLFTAQLDIWRAVLSQALPGFIAGPELNVHTMVWQLRRPSMICRRFFKSQTFELSKSFYFLAISGLSWKWAWAVLLRHEKVLGTRLRCTWDLLTARLSILSGGQKCQPMFRNGIYFPGYPRHPHLKLCWTPCRRDPSRKPALRFPKLGWVMLALKQSATAPVVWFLFGGTRHFFG